MNWRPLSWKNLFNPAAVFVRDSKNVPVSHHDAFELGADAMFVAALDLIGKLGYHRVVTDIRLYTLKEELYGNYRRSNY